MSEKERNIAESLTRACELLPDGKKEYLIGYAEGVAAMAEKAKERTNGDQESRQQGGVILRNFGEGGETDGTLFGLAGKHQVWTD